MPTSGFYQDGSKTLEAQPLKKPCVRQKVPRCLGQIHFSLQCLDGIKPLAGKMEATPGLLGRERGGVGRIGGLWNHKKSWAGDSGKIASKSDSQSSPHVGVASPGQQVISRPFWLMKLIGLGVSYWVAGSGFIPLVPREPWLDSTLCLSWACCGHWETMAYARCHKLDFSLPSSNVAMEDLRLDVSGYEAFMGVID